MIITIFTALSALAVWMASAPFESDIDSARLAPADADMVLHVPSLSEFARSALSAKPCIVAGERAATARGATGTEIPVRELVLALAREGNDRIIGFFEPTSLLAWWRSKPIRENTESRLYGRAENRRTAPYDCGMVLGIDGRTAGAICRLLRHRTLFERCLMPFVSNDVGLEWQRGAALVRAPSSLFPPGWFAEYLPPAAIHIGIRGNSLVVGTDGKWVRDLLGIGDSEEMERASMPADAALATFISRSSVTLTPRHAAARAAEAVDAGSLFEFLGGIPESELSFSLRRLDASGFRLEMAFGSTLMNAPLRLPKGDGTIAAATSHSARDAARFLFSRLDAIDAESVLVSRSVDDRAPLPFREWFPEDAREAVLSSLAAAPPFRFVLEDAPDTEGARAPRTHVPKFIASFAVEDRVALVAALRATPFGGSALPANPEPGRCYRLTSSELLGVEDAASVGIVISDDSLILISDASGSSPATKVAAFAENAAPIEAAVRFEMSGDAVRRRVATSDAVRARRAAEPSAREWRVFEDLEKGRIDDLFSGRTDADLAARKQKLFDERTAEWIAARQAAIAIGSPIERAVSGLADDVDSISIVGKSTAGERLALTIDVAIAARAR